MQLFSTPTLDPNDFADTEAQLVARYPAYAEAHQAIDRLAAASFPVQHTEILGRDLRLVEHVTGGATSARSAVTGVLTGAWFGLLIGLLVGLLTIGPAWIGLLLGGLAIGAASAAAFDHLAHRTEAGPHDYQSLRALEANSYELWIHDGYAQHARQLLHLN